MNTQHFTKQFVDNVQAEIRELCKLTLTHHEQISGSVVRTACAIAKANGPAWAESAISVTEAADLSLELASV